MREYSKPRHTGRTPVSVYDEIPWPVARDAAYRRKIDAEVLRRDDPMHPDNAEARDA